MNETNEIRWKLSCPFERAIEIISKSVDHPFKSSLLGKNNFKGNIKGNNFEIWSKTPGLRGYRVAICSGHVSPIENGYSYLRAQFHITVPFKYISLGWKSLSILIPLSVLAFFSCVLGLVFEKYKYFESIGFPIGAATILVFIIGIGRYLADHDLIYLRRFLESLFSEYMA